MESRFTWMDGELIPTERAVVPFLTSGLHYGLGVFEGIRCYATERGPAIFRLSDHALRLVDSAKVLGLELRFDETEIAEGCREVVRANGLDECYVRPLAFTTTAGWNLSVLGAPVSLGIAAWPWNQYLGEEALRRGVRANVASFTRHHPNVMMTKAKISGNYVNSVLARTESLRLGFDEAILLDPAGYVAECTGENIFVVKRGRIFTPPSTSVLEGITRDTVFRIAADLGYDVQERMLSRDQLYIADELFVCGTAAEVIGLREVDGREIGEGVTGPVTASVQRAYHAAVKGEDERYLSWVDFVARQAGAEAVVAEGPT